MHRPLSYIEISSHALRENVRTLRGLAPQKQCACVVKANAYGHGQHEVISLIQKECDYLQVDDIEELRAVCALTQKPTFVFGYVQKENLAEAVSLQGILCIYDEARIRLLESIGKKRNTYIPIHIKIDALLGRQGVLPKDVSHIIDVLKKSPHVRLEGIYSHFSNIEDTKNSAHALRQWKQFTVARELFSRAGYINLLVHISATSGVLTHDPMLPTSLVRLGLGMYGMWPSEALAHEWKKKITLHPVVRWVTHVAQVKKIPTGFPVGYGCTFIAKRPTTIAVLPQGYSDGYDRGLSNKGEVLIHGKKVPIIGRVAMNMIVADVTRISGVHEEDEVVLLGSQGGLSITAESIAEKIATINYEVTTRISPLLPRIITK